MRYNPREIEPKWQKCWLEDRTYEPDLAPRQTRGKKRAKNPFYNLMMFPYPSAEGLHVGNMYAFVGADIYGRLKRMQGHDVFEPIGLDGFGIHSENYALKIGKHPARQSKISEKNFYRQLEMIGNGFAWEERLETYDPDYYKWTQWIFVQMFKKGLAYRKKAAVNWCPSCKTVLADEQVISGACERCGTKVIKKELEQWFFKITQYAERLLKNLEKIDWSEKIKIAQKNWIGRSEGALLRFNVKCQMSTHSTSSGLRLRGSDSRRLMVSVAEPSNVKCPPVEVFTTRPDTLFGATYMVLAPEHTLISNLKSLISNYKEVEEYVKKSKATTEEERIAEGREKTGVVLKGIKAINPANKEEIPVWVADYVLASVGTGAIMAVPAHDERDFEFAKKFKLPIIEVIKPPRVTPPPIPGAGFMDTQLKTECWTGDGTLINSGRFNGVDCEKAKWEITKFVDGEKKVQYRLRDWLISRQRYWGPPIPMIYCAACAARAEPTRNNINSRSGTDAEKTMAGWHPVPEKDLPVKLPYIKNFRPTGTEKSPLALVEKFYKTRCPKCNAEARRETDVSDTFLDSAWYYLGYLMKFGNWKLGFGNSAFSRLARKWLPVDMYIGGAEHAVLHLLYVRFLAMAFYDLGLIHFEEPFKQFRAHGLLIKDGAKMSKSKGNVVNPDEYIKAYGADALRMYLMFLGPFEHGGDFRDTGIRGITRFLERTWRFVSNSKLQSPPAQRSPHRADELEGNAMALSRPKLQRAGKTKNNPLEPLLHKTLKKVTEDIEGLHYNTAISALMMLLNEFEARPDEVSKEQISVFLKLLAPFAPHLAEELWQLLCRQQQTSMQTAADSPPLSASGPQKSASIHNEPWPQFDPELLKEEEKIVVIQINGKVRDRITVPQDISEKELKEKVLVSDKVKKWVDNKKVLRYIITQRVVNVVMKAN